MSLDFVPRCPNCDARTDPYGRDGGHSWCQSCRAKAGHFDDALTEVHGDPLLNMAVEQVSDRRAA